MAAAPLEYGPRCATIKAIAHKHGISSNQETNTLDVRPGKKLVLLDGGAQLLSNIDPRLRVHMR